MSAGLTYLPPSGLWMLCPPSHKLCGGTAAVAKAISHDEGYGWGQVSANEEQGQEYHRLAADKLRVRLGAQDAALVWIGPGASVGALKADDVLHPGLLGVGLGQGNGLGVDIAADDAVLAVKLPGLGRGAGFFKVPLAAAVPALGGEAAREAGSAVAGNPGRLDAQGAAAAERV